MQSQKDAAPNMKWTDLVSSPENNSLFVDSFVEMAKRKCDAIFSYSPRYVKIATKVLNFKYINSNVYIKKKIKNKSVYDSLKYSGDQLRLTKLFSLVNAKIPDNISKLIFGLSISAAERIEEKRRGDKSGKAQRQYNTSLGVSNALIALEIVELIADYENAKQSGETGVVTKSLLYIAFLLGLVSENSALRNEKQIYLIGDYARWRRIYYSESKAIKKVLSSLKQPAKLEALKAWNGDAYVTQTVMIEDVWKNIKKRINEFVDDEIPNLEDIINKLKNRKTTPTVIAKQVRSVGNAIGTSKTYGGTLSSKQKEKIKARIAKQLEQLEQLET